MLWRHLIKVLKMCKFDIRRGDNVKMIKKLSILLIIIITINLLISTKVFAEPNDELVVFSTAQYVRNYVVNPDVLDRLTRDQLLSEKQMIESALENSSITSITLVLNNLNDEGEQIYFNDETTQETIDQLLNAINERLQDLEDQTEDEDEQNGGTSTSSSGNSGNPTEAEVTPPFSGGSWVNPDSYNPGELTDAGKVMEFGNSIIGIIQFVGTFASVIVLIILGIKYMLGSVEEKAEYKKTMWPYLIGAILVFATTTILSVIETISKQI